MLDELGEIKNSELRTHPTKKMVLFRNAVALALASAFFLHRCNAVPSADIPIGHTPPPGSGGPITPLGCGYKSLPKPILANCTDELAPSVPDLRGLWVGKVGSDEKEHWERIEQCGDRVRCRRGLASVRLARSAGLGE